MRRMHTWTCAVAVALLAASCSLVSTVPDLTSGSADAGPEDAGFCDPRTFTYDAKGRVLTSVHLAGSFNDWPKTIAAGGWPLANTGGTWTLTRNLPGGRNLYKLVLNESEWILDPANTNVLPDSSGNKNSFIDATCNGDR